MFSLKLCAKICHLYVTETNLKEDLSFINPYPHGLLNELKPTGGGAETAPPMKNIVNGLILSPKSVQK